MTPPGNTVPEPIDSPLPGKNPRLLPTPSLSWEEFEDLTERLLSAHRFCAEPLRHVVRVERWGRRGDKQDGIDFEGTFSDGKTASWQCKRYDKLAVGDVRDAVQACTFRADEHYLVFSGEASRDVRDEIAKHPKWELLDQRGLGRLVDDLPLHKRRDVLDATWGAQKRKLLMEVPGEDAFLSLDTFIADRRNPDAVINDLGGHVGRENELAAVRTALDRSGDWPAIVMITGPGGRGKTRLLVEALAQFQHENPEIPVICLAPGRAVDAAALAELPHTPAVVVVDDAHRDPVGIASLLHYLRSAEGTQLVLGARPSGTASLEVEVTNARYAPSQVTTVPVGELSRPQANALVKSLVDGLGLTLAVREYFAAQATDSPYLVVVAAYLIRQGEVTGPLAVDCGLREQVLARYQDVLAGQAGNADANVVRRVLAVYDALGPVDDSDDDLRAKIAAFCRIKTADLLRLAHRLHDRGALVTRNGLTRVVPDVLGDQILESEAAVGRHDTGFAAELWDAFGHSHGDRLVIALGELDWRLTRNGGPSVMGSVWEAVRAELRAADYPSLYSALGRLAKLATTQPHALIDVLEETRRRLDDETSDVAASADSPTVATGPAPAEADGDSAIAGDAPMSAEAADSLWAYFQIKPEDADDVRRLLPEIYGRCAAAAPELLETALDALWALRRNDTRPVHAHPGHPERVITDRLGSLGELPHPSFPLRIVARVTTWLAESASDSAAATPMFALRPLLAKDGYRHFPETRRQITYRPYAVSATWARPLRDAIRAILRFQASGTDLRRAGAATELLGEALRQPSGQFGRSVGPDEVLSWEDDDLATLAVFCDAAGGTSSPVIRRLIREKVSWAAKRATSLPVRHAALTLLTALDERDDDLAHLLGHGFGLPTQRGIPVPTLEELTAAAASRIESDTDTTQEHPDATHWERLKDRIASQEQAHDMLVEHLAEHLVESGGPTHVVETLDHCCREICLVRPGHIASLPSLFRRLGSTRPDVVPEMVREIAVRPTGPLDGELHLLLGTWAEHAEATLLDWLDGLPEQRCEVRLAVATAFVNYGWTDRSDAFAAMHHRSAADPAQAVRDQFLIARHRLLTARPADAVEELLAGSISPPAATRVLELACRYDGAPWGSRLGYRDAAAVLRLVDHAGWDERLVQHVVAGIARAHPALVLDHLATAHHDGNRLPIEVDGLPVAFDERAEALSNWLVTRAQQDEPQQVAVVAGLAMDNGLTKAQAHHLAAAVDRLDEHGLIGLAVILSSVDMWPLQQPDLTRRFTSRARQLGADTAARIRGEISDAMQAHGWSFVNGQSPELQRARTAVASCVETETDPELKEDFRHALARIEAEAASGRRIHDDVDDI